MRWWWDYKVIKKSWPRVSGIVNVIIGCVVYMLEVSANNEEDNTVAVAKKSYTFKLQNKEGEKIASFGCHTKAGDEAQ